MKTTIITFRINPTDKKLLEKHAEETNTNKSDLLRQIILDFLIQKKVL